LSADIQEIIRQVRSALGSSQELAIGSKFLLRLLYAQKVEGIAIVPPGDVEIPIETLDQSQFAYYDWDVVCLDDIRADIWITSGILVGSGTATPAGGVQCALLKRRNFKSPDKIDVILSISNGIGGSGLTLAYKVYRRAGLD